MICTSAVGRHYPVGVFLIGTLFAAPATAQYVIDDGTVEEEVGNGKTPFNFVFLNSFQTDPSRNVITSISIAFGNPADTASDEADGFPTNGVPIIPILWSDPNGDGHPNDAQVLTTTNGFTALHGTNQFVTFPIAPIW